MADVAERSSVSHRATGKGDPPPGPAGRLRKAEIVRTATDRFVLRPPRRQNTREARFLALSIIRNGEFYVVYGASSRKPGPHLIAAGRNP